MKTLKGKTIEKQKEHMISSQKPLFAKKVVEVANPPQLHVLENIYAPLLRKHDVLGRPTKWTI
jgi:hypothetical protein